MDNYPKNMNSGSDKYGNCELCNKKADSIYIHPDGKNGYIFAHLDCINKYILDNSAVKKQINKCKNNDCDLTPPCPDCGTCLIDFPVGA